MNQHLDKAAQKPPRVDERKRKRAHRKNAKLLLSQGGFFNGFSARGSTFHSVATWHKKQARKLAQR